ncbi:MAG: YraN family protein [Bacteroidota bacterium]
MTRSHQLGQAGEQAAAAYLSRLGYEILEMNVRLGRGELDIIARSPSGEIVFAEVKTRSRPGYPELAVTPDKQQRMISAASTWLDGRPEHAGTACRFDVLALNRKNSGFSCRHLEDAFWAE